ncbi:MAG: sensor histidine kinase [Chloroflexi bacterium]|nr:MAG: sensor histidine kinase [Chloroflexota bacterium]
MSVADPRTDQVAPIVALPSADNNALFESYRIRSELARELHDDVVQTLNAVLIQSRVFAREQQGNKEVVEQLAYVHTSIRDVLNHLRQILSDLRGQPGLETDLVLAIRDGLLTRFATTRLKVTLSVSRSWPAALPPETAIQLYRIIQEALTNAHKHGGASNAEVDLKATANVIVCTIRDDGRGIAWLDDSRPIGMGILGMKERAAALGGTLTIRNRPRGGTAVTASFSKEATEWRLKPEPSGS